MTVQQVIEARNRHYEYIESMKKAWADKARAERDAKIADGAATAALRSQGVPATLIPRMVAGDPSVAEANCNVAIMTGVAKAADALVQASYLDWKIEVENYQAEWREAGFEERYNRR